MNPLLELGGFELTIAVTFLVLIEALFSGSEIAILSCDKTKMKLASDKGSRGAKLALKLSDQQEIVLSTTLLMTSICIILLTTLIEIFFSTRSRGSTEIHSILVASTVVIIFGELIPKAVFRRFSDRLAPRVSFIVNIAYRVFFPITFFLSFVNAKLSKLIGPAELLITGKKRTTRDELKSLLSIGSHDVNISKTEKRMIRRILDFKETAAGEAFIPLVEVDAIPVQTTIRQAVEFFIRNRHSRIPVYQSRIDNIVGILDVRDLLRAKDISLAITPFVKAPHYIAETQRLEDILKEMHSQKSEMVIVVDEHGGAVGIMTTEDIVEEIVGEIQDEYDVDSAWINPLKENSAWVIQARMGIVELNEQLRLDLPEGEYETLSGFLLKQFGRIPDPGDELFFSTPSAELKFVVKSGTQRRIDTVVVEKMTLQP